ncbi:MAG: hypothetical protein K9L17_05995 [Clostridiales bacterium]|nr:hypothetical protein [Clostridiales bacterium]MCF8022224.1 hypothetical protein [Clostridiales bacterium]
MSKKKRQNQQKTFKGELVEERTPEGFRDLAAEEEHAKENPYKTPPNNLTNKAKDYNVKG